MSCCSRISESKSRSCKQTEVFISLIEKKNTFSMLAASEIDLRWNYIGLVITEIDVIQRQEAKKRIALTRCVVDGRVCWIRTIREKDRVWRKWTWKKNKTNRGNERKRKRVCRRVHTENYCVNSLREIKWEKLCVNVII